MKLPIQAPPVIRTDLFKPHTVVDLNSASNDTKRELLLSLLDGANYNDPMRFLMSADYCGCHILSGNSMAMCLAACGFF
ncbi:MAG: cyanobactin biosynthesis system PatB/AcyB/McaB family protein [Okeania sp. SIO3H1]|uniref:cyanobactin biosynthesis system PatB/AcyB/McaB family protein n=1 Tax=Okeania sp. SIO1I7 TaxID=2607772 RepID=UPI0013CCC6A3|nr:cyanobactin biosynthesis system PatB/AcyB/McaB family protein [Okeania sp. SIO1I7]NEN88985.1 cyanobactin biosynthesis system PatB/AcyB/McaB family protein [Okeania sp. SIO3H1]NET24927.1 cyanobactin biosynthesis system PatB/AcyB/McaB family protein [Okeania sp. SIO1I7]